MKKIGLWLLKNNIHIMTLIFLGWAVWGICNWNSLALVQKLVLGMYAWLIIHEYEEGYKGRFLDLMAGRLLQLDYRALTPGPYTGPNASGAGGLYYCDLLVGAPVS